MEQGADRPRVLIAGGGVAGLETLLALGDLAPGLAVTLVAPEPEFTYKPWLVEEPFSFDTAQRVSLEPVVAERGGEFVQAGLAEVRAGAHEAALTDGRVLAYDVAVVCVGARPRPAFRRGVTLMPGGTPFRMDELLEPFASAGGTIAFVVPPGVTWSLPVYELAMMTRRRAQDRRLDVEIVVVTPEESPLGIFGTAASEAVTELLAARGVGVRTGARVTETTAGDLELVPGGERLEVDEVVSLPSLEGPGIAGLPSNDGFIPIDEHARVVGADDVYAAGDGTTFPIKQGGIGTQQADAAARHIASRFAGLADPQPFRPVLRGKLVTGEESVHLRHEVAGGAGEGVVSDDYLWWPPHKVSGLYLAPWLAGETPSSEPEPPRRSLDVEVALPREWHHEPMALDPRGELGD